jgi:hypothetical protein
MGTVYLKGIDEPQDIYQGTREFEYELIENEFLAMSFYTFHSFYN